MRQRDLQNETSPLVTVPVAVDLIRFEKNLLQIGFFGAHDTRHNTQDTRRIEQWANREGQRTRVSAEFRASGSLGLPSTSDRDKYIAFMKIAMDQRAKMGRLENPIRFTGYQMLKELRMSYSGENYEDINRWGQRMAGTSITSEQVIYLAARRRYANKTVHVFRSFVRSGKVNADGSGRAEFYEVVLEDWLLDNLNQSYVIPEDFNAYRCLKRPTAKGIFGYLHLWFHASRGRAVEKDYGELCVLLNIPVYRHMSKIRETMGQSLDELGEIGYLSSWDVAAMVTKPGFKLVLQAGETLLRVLAISQRKELGAAGGGEAAPARYRQLAGEQLIAWGISEGRAEELLRQHEAETLLELIEYVTHRIRRSRRTIDNPAGFLIYAIESKMPVPSNFRSSFTQRTEEAVNAGNPIQPDQSYGDYVQQRLEEEIRQRFPGAALKKQIQKVISDRVRYDQAFRAMDKELQEAVVEEWLYQEIRESGVLMSFDEWCATAQQLSLASVAE